MELVIYPSCKDVLPLHPQKEKDLYITSKPTNPSQQDSSLSFSLNKEPSKGLNTCVYYTISCTLNS